MSTDEKIYFIMIKSWNIYQYSSLYGDYCECSWIKLGFNWNIDTRKTGIFS